MNKKKLSWVVRIGSLVEYWKGNIIMTFWKSPKKALYAYDRAIKINPNCYEAWYGKAKILCILNFYLEAYVACERAIQINPHHYKRAIPINTNDEDAWDVIVRSLKASGLYKKGLALCEKAININPSFIDIWRFKGIILFLLGREEEALVCITQAKSLTKAKSLIGTDQEKLVDFLFDVEVAQEIFLAAAWNPELDIFTRTHLYTSAEKIFLDTLEISEVIKNLDEITIIGVTLQYASRVQYAYLKAFRYLGQILAKRDQKYHEAIKLYDIALSINSHDPETLMLKSASQYDLGQKIEAIKTINKAIKYCDTPWSKSNYERIKARLMMY